MLNVNCETLVKKVGRFRFFRSFALLGWQGIKRAENFHWCETITDVCPPIDRIFFQLPKLKHICKILKKEKWEWKMQMSSHPASYTCTGSLDKLSLICWCVLIRGSSKSLREGKIVCRDNLARDAQPCCIGDISWKTSPSPSSHF